MQIQRINSQDLLSQNKQIHLSKEPCPSNNLTTNQNDIFLTKNRNVSFGDGDGAITGGLSLAAIYGVTQVGCTAFGAKVGDKLSDN